MPRKVIEFSPGRIILISLLAAIAFGTFLLLLPISRSVSVPFIDLLFTATSATCVTGLLTIPTTSFSPFGQLIILFLIQVGGLGLITMTLFIMSIFVELGLTTQLLAGRLLELETWKNIKDLLFFIFKFTIALEGIGALFTFFIVRHEYPLLHGLFFSIFHAISAFCDAGFYVFPGGLIAYKNNHPMLIITSILMLSGGLGFITWHELIEYIESFFQKKRKRLSLYSKIVLSTTAFLIITSSLLFWILERNNTLAAMTPFTALLNTLFNAIASRSTGFSTMYTSELHIATLFMIALIAFIGSSPGSTGSGIKTTTFAIFLATVRTAVMDYGSVQIKGRRIATDQVHKALAIISLSLAWIIITTFCLLITEHSWEFFDILFEVISAFATLGLSTGITPYLSPIGKLFIITTMIVGRIGALTFLLALRKKREVREFEYPEERVMLG
jgi:trk system potassium uptake protein TrkH